MQCHRFVKIAGCTRCAVYHYLSHYIWAVLYIKDHHPVPDLFLNQYNPSDNQQHLF